MEAIELLAAKWREAKAKEDAGRDERVDVEQQILALNPAREEGSQTITTPTGIKITTTGKLTYKADLAKVLEITQSWPQDAKPIKTEVKVDEAILKALREHSPDAWRQLSPAVTVTPAKTGVKVVFAE